MSLPIAKPPRPVPIATAIAERAVPTVLPADATPAPREATPPEFSLVHRLIWGVGSLAVWLWRNEPAANKGTQPAAAE